MHRCPSRFCLQAQSPHSLYLAPQASITSHHNLNHHLCADNFGQQKVDDTKQTLPEWYKDSNNACLKLSLSALLGCNSSPLSAYTSMLLKWRNQIQSNVGTTCEGRQLHLLPSWTLRVIIIYNYNLVGLKLPTVFANVVDIVRSAVLKCLHWDLYH